jgi:ATP-dependent DNA helicase RecQ
VLLGYFGEKLEVPCGNCDICLDPPETYDAIKPAQLAIQCIHELEEHYSKEYVIDILRGSTAARIIERGHDKLKTYGAGMDMTADEWTSILRQLVHQGYCNPDISHRSALRLTPEATKLDKRKHLMLAHFHQGVNRGLKRPVVNRADPVFVELSDLRREMAAREGVAPHVLMNDATLAEMSHKRPQSLDDLSAIDGMGQKKVQTYGESFLHLLVQHGAAEADGSDASTTPDRNQKQRMSGAAPNDAQMFTWQLYRSGEDAASIAAQQGVSDETVLKHFVALVKAGYDINVRVILGEVFDEVTAAVEAADEYASLTDIKRSMDTPVSNEAFRLVMAWREAAGVS